MQILHIAVLCCCCCRFFFFLLPFIEHDFEHKDLSTSQYAVPLTCLGALSKDNHVASSVGKKHHETAFPS